MERERFDPADLPRFVPEDGDSGLGVSFAVGPSGVGPVMGFGTDDFFPVVPVADPETGPHGVDPSQAAETGGSPAADRSAGMATASVDEPTPDADAPTAP